MGPQALANCAVLVDGYMLNPHVGAPPVIVVLLVSDTPSGRNVTDSKNTALTINRGRQCSLVILVFLILQRRIAQQVMDVVHGLLRVLVRLW